MKIRKDNCTGRVEPLNTRIFVIKKCSNHASNVCQQNRDIEAKEEAVTYPAQKIDESGQRPNQQKLNELRERIKRHLSNFDLVFLTILLDTPNEDEQEQSAIFQPSMETFSSGKDNTLVDK